MIIEGLGVAVFAKVAGIVASYYVSWTAYSTMPEVSFRYTLNNMFKVGDMCLKKKAGGKQKEVRLFPKVHRVKQLPDRMQAVFSVPTGYDPKDVFNHDWLFQQAFGEEIEVRGTVKTFTLNVYKEGIKMYDYDLSVVGQSFKGLRLPIYVGIGRDGDIAYDMCEFPHLLIAGETGSGKSVALRSILVSLVLFVNEKIELHCADLKRSEFHLFRGIAEGKVLHDAANLTIRLKKIQKEMQRRGDLLDAEGLANVNDLPANKKVKYIVLAIDEVALLQKEQDCMEIIEEISAIGRALGVFLILAMQRPDKDVLDGKLKNNLTVRMAFRHSNDTNSRITLDSGEAADIKQSEKGRMVLLLDGLQSAQAPLLDIPTARAMLDPYKRDTPEPPEKPRDNDDLELGGL